MGTKTNNFTLNIPQVVDYKSLHLPHKFEDNDLFRNKLKENILLQVQGDSVELNEGKDIAVLLIAIEIIRKVCPSAVYKLINGDQIMLFDYQSAEKIEPFNINKDFVNFEWVEQGKEKKEEITINLDLVWQETLGKQFLERIKMSLKAIEDELNKAKSIILLGNKQPLLFLIVYLKAYQLAAKVFYQWDEDSDQIPIN